MRYSWDMAKDAKQIMQHFPPALDAQVTLANWREPVFSRWSFSHVRQILPTAPINAGADSVTPQQAMQDLTSLPFTHEGVTHRLGNWLDTSRTDAFLVMHRGRLAFEWFGGWGAADRQHIIFSVSKSLTALLAGILCDNGVLDPQRPVQDYLPEVAGSAYADALLRHVLDMTVASGFTEDYLDTTGVFMAYRRASAWNPLDAGTTTDGLRAFLATLPPADGNHGYRHHYCSPHTDLLGWIIERASGTPFNLLFSELLMRPLGAAHDGYVTLDAFGAPRVAGGICVAPHDLLRFAEMVRNFGSVGTRQIVPESWIADFRNFDDPAPWQRQQDGPRHFPDGSYRSKWYRTGLPDDEFAAIGIHGQWIWVNPTREVTIIRMASNDLPIDPDAGTVLQAAFDAVCQAFEPA
ncbi:MAG: serine hydrolase [Alphaproteobacteria bacterium]|nr:serine hydrolase [Alphaproteobacteria bacterium]